MHSSAHKTRTTNRLEELNLACAALRNAVASQNYLGAQELLADCGRRIEAVLPELTVEERTNLRTSVMALLDWAQMAVKTGRRHGEQQLSSLAGSKLYRMPDPRKRTTWNLEF